MKKGATEFMNSIKSFLKTLIYRISYEYKNKKDLSNFIQKKQKYLSMTDDEFMMKYIELSTQCERKKYILSTLSITLIISLLLDVWKNTFSAIGKLLITENYEFTNNNMEKEISIIMVLLIIMLCASGVLLIVCLLRQYYQLLKEKRLMEEIKILRQQR